MTITLGGIELPDLVKDFEHSWSGVEAVADRSIGGAPIIWERKITGRPLDLVGGEDTAWIARSTLNALQALAGVPRATYVLDYEGVQNTVRFRHEDGHAIEATPLVARPNHEDADYYRNVRIRLMVL